MYERGLKNGKMILDDSDPANPANIRVAADDRVTFPTAWSAPQAVVPRGQQGAVTLTPRGPRPAADHGTHDGWKITDPTGKPGKCARCCSSQGRCSRRLRVSKSKVRSEVQTGLHRAGLWPENWRGLYLLRKKLPHPESSAEDGRHLLSGRYLLCRRCESAGKLPDARIDLPEGQRFHASPAHLKLPGQYSPFRNQQPGRIDGSSRLPAAALWRGRLRIWCWSQAHRRSKRMPKSSARSGESR